MKSPKMVGFIFALTASLLGPLRAVAQPQEEQTSAQTVEVEIHPVASLLTAVNVPARVVLCGLSGWMASIVMTFSAGRRYADAAKMMEDGCSGPWVITPEMLEEGRKKEKNEPGGSEKPSLQDGGFSPGYPLN